MLHYCSTIDVYKPHKSPKQQEQELFLWDYGSL